MKLIESVKYLDKSMALQVAYSVTDDAFNCLRSKMYYMK